jgi:hypothetical protein
MKRVIDNEYKSIIQFKIIGISIDLTREREIFSIFFQNKIHKRRYNSI